MTGMHAIGILSICGLALGALWLSGGCIREVGEAQLFYPHRYPEVEEQPGRRNMAVQTDDGVTLRGWLLEAENSHTTIIYFYGNGETVADSRFRLAWMVKNLDVNVLALDYRGYGFSDGTPTVETLAQDAVRGYDLLMAERAGFPHRVLAYGRSIGTAAALELAAERPIDALILEAPFPGMKQVVAGWQRNLRVPVRWFVRLRADRDLAERSPQPLDQIVRFDRPLLVIHGVDDTIIPVALGRAMFDAAPGPNKTWCEVSGAGHNDLPINHPSLEPVLRRFVNAAPVQ